MGWASTRWLGCCIGSYTGMYITECRYEPNVYLCSAISEETILAHRNIRLVEHVRHAQREHLVHPRSNYAYEKQHESDRSI
ncbi:hypothetical protein OESDEN_10653 [Oesophagostomum dentatum]|uniref:Uncharacterized protein n=1 Tax=Oesophagostomum dentatum TaxID=61180 RepID=A0A0B1T025_OESDE|nr:hypothetical protein OESDEN_10653 [Oesophagostomum dentatum]